MRMWFTRLKNKVSITLLAAGMLLPASHAFAQDAHGHFGCGTDQYWQEKVKNNPAARMSWELTEQKIAEGGHAFKDEDTRIIPVVFHIIHNYGTENIPKQRIYDQMATLNSIFRATNPEISAVRPEFKDVISDFNVEFRLATIDPNGNCTDGITRTNSSLTVDARDNVKSIIRWDTRKYLNVWVVASIENTGQQGTILGFAQFPWDNDLTTDGIVMRADQVVSGNKTLTHEIGHYLGLYHTFETYAGGSECGRNCNSSGDRVCDTPPTDGPNYICATNKNSCTSESPDRYDMVENYMDYSNCPKMFSAGQKVRVDANFINTKRKDLVSAGNLAATGTATIKTTPAYCSPVVDFYTPRTTVCQGSDVQFYSNISNADVTKYEWTFPQGSPATSAEANPKVKFTKSGTYAITLKVSNPNDSKEMTRQGYITVLSAESETKAPLYENFENFNASVYQINKDSKGLQWRQTSSAAYRGTSSLMLNNLSGETNAQYSVTLPPLDFTTATDHTLKFKYAYARLTNSSFDELRIEVSNDCEMNYNAIYAQLGKLLATKSELVTAAFIPEDEDWKQVELDLKSFKTSTAVFIRFNFKSRGGNNIYMDDINFGNAVSGIAPAGNAENALSIYPNPSNAGFSLALSGDAKSPATLALFDVTGKRIQLLTNLRLGNGNPPVQLSREDLNIPAAGVYYLKLNQGNSTWTEKIVVMD